jgi:hypothetical protein
LLGIFRGRKRADGLPSGSGAAQATDLEKDRLRKQNERAAKRLVEPPPTLPANLESSPQSGPAVPGPVLPLAGSPMSGAALPPSVPVVEAPPILWVGQDLAPVTDELVPLLEEIRRDRKLERLRKAKIDPALIKEIEKDFHWPDKSKLMLSKTGASLGAKYLNRAEISAAYKDEVNFGVAFLVIARCEAALNRRLDKLITAAEKAAAPAAPPPVAPLTLSDSLRIPAPPAEKKTEAK